MNATQHDDARTSKRGRRTRRPGKPAAWWRVGVATLAGLASATAAVTACGPGGPDIPGLTTGSSSSGGTSTSTGTGASTTGSSSSTSTSTSASSTSTSSSSSGATTGCHGTLTGAVTGSFDCTVSAAYDGTVTGVAIVSTTVPAGVSLVAGGGSVSGPIADMTYPFGSFVKWGYSVLATDLTVWGTNQDKPNGGTQSMTITSFTVTLNDDNSMAYDVHGSYDAVGPWINATPDPGTEVTAHVDF